VPAEQKAPSLDLDGDGSPETSALAAEFILHGFYPVPDAFHPWYRVGTTIGHTDHVPATPTGLVPRLNEAHLPGEAIRLVNTGTAPATFAIDVVYPGGTSHFDVPVAAGATRVLPFRLPPYWQAVVDPDGPLPDCGGPDQETVTLRVTPAGGQPVSVDNCRYWHAVVASTDGSALTVSAAGTGPAAPGSAGLVSPIVLAGLAAAAVLAFAITFLMVRRSGGRARSG